VIKDFSESNLFCQERESCVFEKLRAKVYNSKVKFTEASQLITVHELAITQNILDIVLNEAKSAQANKVTKINLVIGELSGTVSDCVQFYFDFLKKDNAAEDATLDFKLVPAELRCRDCLTAFNPKDSAWICPNCKGTSLDVVSGRECYVESIEVE
jgi:hydrogenase nickel incorporation protein HypA/HybF